MSLAQILKSDSTDVISIAEGRDSLPYIYFVRVSRKAFGGFHPRDNTVPFTAILAGTILSESGFGSSIIELSGNMDIPESEILRMKKTGAIVFLKVEAGELETFRKVSDSLNGLPVKKVAYRYLADTCPDEILKSGVADYCVIGEGENVIPELVESIINTQGREIPPGVKWLKDGKIESSGEAPLPNTDYLPFISASIINTDYYRKYSMPVSIGKRRKWGFILANRGCRYVCNYCTGMARQSMRRKYRLCSPERLVKEMVYQASECGRTIISIEDDLFTGDREWTLKVCDLLDAAGYSTPWIAQTRFDCLDEELMIRMKKAGCVGLSCGIESGSEIVLNSMNRKQKISDVIEKGKLLIKLGLDVRCTLMIGSPGETEKDFEETEKLVKELSPLTVQVSFNTPYPDTLLPNKMNTAPSGNHLNRLLCNQSAMKESDVLRLRRRFYLSYYLSSKYARLHGKKWLLNFLFHPKIAFYLIHGFFRFTMHR